MCSTYSAYTATVEAEQLPGCPLVGGGGVAKLTAVTDAPRENDSVGGEHDGVVVTTRHGHHADAIASLERRRRLERYVVRQLQLAGTGAFGGTVATRDVAASIAWVMAGGEGGVETTRQSLAQLPALTPTPGVQLSSRRQRDGVA